MNWIKSLKKIFVDTIYYSVIGAAIIIIIIFTIYPVSNTKLQIIDSSNTSQL